jgi:hypothetical protein
LLRFLDKWSPLAVPRFSTQSGPSFTMWFTQFTENVTKIDHKAGSYPHSTEHDTQPTSYLISKSFHAGHVVAPVVLGCLLLTFGP